MKRVNNKILALRPHRSKQLTTIHISVYAGYVFHGRGQSSLQPPSTGTQAQRAASNAHADRLMDGVGHDADCDGGFEGGGGAASAIDYGAGAEEYLLGGGGGGFGGVLGSRKRRRQEVVVSEYRPRPTDYLQAFSHFSYIDSERKMLVCDLQGVRSHTDPGDPDVAGVFELTGELSLLWFLLLCAASLAYFASPPCAGIGEGVSGASDLCCAIHSSGSDKRLLFGSLTDANVLWVAPVGDIPRISTQPRSR